MYRGAALVLVSSACGRIAFDPLLDAPLPDATQGCQGGSRVVVDEFASGLATQLEVTAIGSMQIRETDLAGVLGGSRTATLFMIAGTGRLTARVGSDLLEVNSSILSDGAIELLYDGRIFDFTDCGTAAVTIASSDLGLDVTLTPTDAAGQTAQLSRSGAATMTATDVTLSLNDPVFAVLDRAHITAIVVRLDGPSGSDFSVTASRAE